MNQTQQNILLLVASIMTKVETTLVYTDKDGVTSIRRVIVNDIARCDNGQVIANCYDLDRDAPRKFRLTGLVSVNPLSIVVVG